jgi:hypothetical protein
MSIEFDLPKKRGRKPFENRKDCKITFPIYLKVKEIEALGGEKEARKKISLFIKKMVGG